MSDFQYSAIDEVLAALRAGRMVIVVDAAERENEGDFVCAAESITPEMVNFMLEVGRGVLCVPLTQEVGRAAATSGHGSSRPQHGADADGLSDSRRSS